MSYTNLVIKLDWKNLSSILWHFVIIIGSETSLRTLSHVLSSVVMLVSKSVCHCHIDFSQSPLLCLVRQNVNSNGQTSFRGSIVQSWQQEIGEGIYIHLHAAATALSLSPFLFILSLFFGLAHCPALQGKGGVGRPRTPPSPLCRPVVCPSVRPLNLPYNTTTINK